MASEDRMRAPFLSCRVVERLPPGDVRPGDRVRCYAFEGEGECSGPHSATVLDVDGDSKLMLVRWDRPTGREIAEARRSGLSAGNGPYGCAFSSAPLRGARRVSV